VCDPRELSERRTSIGSTCTFIAGLEKLSCGHSIVPYVQCIVCYARWIRVAHVMHASDLQDPAVRLYAGIAV
jgi:hypothetical protein